MSLADACNGDILDAIAQFLDTNDIACGLLLVNKATANRFRNRQQYRTVRLSQPVPPHAFRQKWSEEDAMHSLTLKQRHQLLCLTASSGSVSNIDVALESVGFIPTMEQEQDLLKAAAAAGQLEACESLLERGYGVTYDTMDQAALSGQLEACELLLDNIEDLGHHGATVYLRQICKAARGGHMHLVDWMLQRPDAPLEPGAGLERLDTSGRRHLLAAAAAGLKLQALRALHDNCFPPGGQQPAQPEGFDFDWLASMASEAAGSPTADWQAKLEWLETMVPTVDLSIVQSRFRVASAAARPDALARLTWLRQHGYFLGDIALEQAARSGNVAAMEYLLSLLPNGARAHPAVCNAAASAGKVEVLRLLHERGARMDGDQLALAAAEQGHRAVLEWAAEALQVDLRDPWFMEAAAKTGGVELMSWLRGRGCKWSAAAFAAAAGSGCEAAVEWMAEQGCPKGTKGAAYLSAARSNDLAMLRCLKGLGCPWGPGGHVFKECVSEPCKPLPLLRCLADELGCPVDWDVALRTARRKYSDCPAEVRTWVAGRQREGQREGRSAPSRLEQWKRRRLQK